MSIHGCWIVMAVVALWCCSPFDDDARKQLARTPGHAAFALTIAAVTAMWRTSVFCLIVLLFHACCCR